MDNILFTRNFGALVLMLEDILNDIIDNKVELSESIILFQESEDIIGNKSRINAINDYLNTLNRTLITVVKLGLLLKQLETMNKRAKSQCRK